MTKAKRTVIYLATGAVAALLVLALVGSLLIQTDWFRGWTRQLIVKRIQSATGTPVTLGAFYLNPVTLQAELHDFTLRGTEPAEAAPLFHAERIVLGAGINWSHRRSAYLRSLTVEKPRINIIVFEDGSNNLPKPKGPPSAKGPLAALVDVAVREFQIRDGVLQVGVRRIQLNLHGENLQSQLFYQFDNPRYLGRLAMNRLSVDVPPFETMTFDLSTSVAVENDRVEVLSALLQKPNSNIRASGAVNNLRAPAGRFDFDGKVSLEELGAELRVPLAKRGAVAVNGKLTFGPDQPLVLAGHLAGSGLAYRDEQVTLDNAQLASDFRLDTHLLEMKNLTASALGGRFTGSLRAEEFRRFLIQGEAKGVSLGVLARATPLRDYVGDYAGTLFGPGRVEFEVRGGRIENALVSGNITIAPSSSAEGVPLEGSVNAVYDQTAQQVEFTDTLLKTPTLRATISGSTRGALKFDAQTGDLHGLVSEIPALRPLEGKLPIRLNQSQARVTGAVTGNFQQAVISGHAGVGRFEFRNVQFSSLDGDFQLSRDHVRVSSFSLGRDTLAVQGQGELQLTGWQAAGGNKLKGAITFKGADLSTLIKESGNQWAVEGQAFGDARIAGTVADPEGSADVQIREGSLFGEPFERMRASLALSSRLLRLDSSRVRIGGGIVRLSGAYAASSDDWKSGHLQAHLLTDGIRLSQIHRAEIAQLDTTATAEADLLAEAELHGVEPLLTSLNGTVGITDLAYHKAPVGKVSLRVRTAKRLLSVEANSELAGTQVNGRGEWQLDGKYSGKGSLDIGRLAFSSLRPWLHLSDPTAPLPADGFVTGRLEFEGNALQPDSWKGTLELPEVQVGANTKTDTDSKSSAVFEFRNSGPVRIELTGETARIRQAMFVGSDTNLQLSGRVTLRPEVTLGLRVQGSANVAILKTFERNLRAAGASVVDATIRGPIASPDLNGRLELKDASFYLADVPNGIDKANGVILFDAKRANIERLTASTGGGQLSMRGFVQFGGPELIYRLQLTAQQVRVRYPEGVSTTSDADLSFSGTTSSSLLSGDVTIVRAAINPQLDFGSLLASAGKPTPAPSSNDLVRGMQFNVRLQLDPEAKLETSLTRDVEAQADLRLRGSPISPVLLGRVIVSQGEINFFDNRYTINRGEVSFVNPVRLEPVLNFDLQTRTRGIDVNISFTGPINKLNVNYRSDPPLQLSEIISLLATGRAPTSDPTAIAQQAQMSQSWQQIGAGSLLAQALTRPVTGRLQKFFGISRLKIDPQLSGLDQEPQARVTVEQQISRDVIFIYTSNLASAQSQAVRLQWDFNKQGSISLGRDENGIVGIDLLIRKRF